MDAFYWRLSHRIGPELAPMSTAHPAAPPERKPKSTTVGPPVAENRRARYDYFITERFEAGVVLEGWEVKAIRAGQVQLTDGYVMVKGNELFLIGCRINPLRNASTHVSPMADRIKKLLLKREDIRKLVAKIEQKGFTLVPLNLHFTGSFLKAEIALAKGKAEHDKRDTEKQRDWAKEKGQIMRQATKRPKD